MIGLWPSCPDAPIVLPVDGELEGLDGSMAGRVGAAFVVGFDTMWLTQTVDGIPVECPHHNPWDPLVGIPIAGLQHVEPGQVVGCDGDFRIKLKKRQQYSNAPILDVTKAGYLVKSYTVHDGPAVWLRDRNDEFLPTQQPQQIAAEIERRRRRVAFLGGLRTIDLWGPHPYLRRQTPHGYVPGHAEDLPQSPELKHARWTGDRCPEPGPISPALPPGQPTPIAGAPYPEQCTDYTLPIEAPGTLQLTVGLRRVFLAHRSMAGPPTVIAEPRRPNAPEHEQNSKIDHVDLPMAGMAVIQAGTIHGLTAPYDVHRIAPDARTRVSTTVRNGPAVWLWGPYGEWLICTDHAPQLAADLFERKRIGHRFPDSSYHGAERRAWRHFVELRPVDLPEGRAVAPPPAYAPAQPTLLPAGCWTPT